MSSSGSEQNQQALAIVQAMVDKSIETIVTPIAADTQTAVREIHSLSPYEVVRSMLARSQAPHSHGKQGHDCR
jgi:hypothetical protein